MVPVRCLLPRCYSPDHRRDTRTGSGTLGASDTVEVGVGGPCSGPHHDRGDGVSGSTPREGRGRSFVTGVAEGRVRRGRGHGRGWVRKWVGVPYRCTHRALRFRPELYGDGFSEVVEKRRKTNFRVGKWECYDRLGGGWAWVVGPGTRDGRRTGGVSRGFLRRGRCRRPGKTHFAGDQRTFFSSDEGGDSRGRGARSE